MNTGISDRTIYDDCSYKKELKQSVSPLSYRLYEGAHEHCKKCVQDNFYRPYDLVDNESELKNITRRLTNCPEFKYNPDCKPEDNTDDYKCMSTFDKNVPVVLAPEVCPVVKTNLVMPKTPGYTADTGEICIPKNNESNERQGVDDINSVPGNIN